MSTKEHLEKIKKKQKIVAWVFLVLIFGLVMAVIISLILMKTRFVGMFLFILALVTALAYISIMHFNNQIFWEKYNDKDMRKELLNEGISNIASQRTKNIKKEP